MHWLTSRLRLTLTSTSVFEDGRLSTHADPTRGQRAGGVGKRTGHAYDQAKFPKVGYSLPRTPMNHRAKFDAASFIVGGKIRNRTNTHTRTHTTVNDISTPCISAYVDNKSLRCRWQTRTAQRLSAR